MATSRPTLVSLLLGCLVLIPATKASAQPVRVRHLEGLTHGFLLLRDLDGNILAHGELDQVVNGKNGLVTTDMRFRFKDGSFYEEVTKFTQRRQFRLLTDKVVQKGPAFKQQSETEIDATTGTVTVRMNDGDKKVTTKHLNIPPDVSNGMLIVLLKNLTETTTQSMVSMVAASSKPRVVQLQISPQEEKTVRFGSISSPTQHFLIKVKIGGIAGAVAPLVGKQPPDINMWIAKTTAPTFLQSEAPLSEGNPVWRIEISAPSEDLLKATR